MRRCVLLALADVGGVEGPVLVGGDEAVAIGVDGGEARAQPGIGVGFRQAQLAVAVGIGILPPVALARVAGGHAVLRRGRGIAQRGAAGIGRGVHRVLGVLLAALGGGGAFGNGVRRRRVGLGRQGRLGRTLAHAGRVGGGLAGAGGGLASLVLVLLVLLREGSRRNQYGAQGERDQVAVECMHRGVSWSGWSAASKRARRGWRAQAVCPLSPGVVQRGINFRMSRR